MEDAGLFWFLLVLVLLLVAFVYQIVTLPPHLAVPAPPPEPPPELEPPAASPELEPSARPLRRAPARPGEAGYQAPHTPRGGGPQVPARGLRPPAVGPAAGWTLAIAGLTIALAGGWLFHRAGVGTGTCSHHAAVACSQGYVLFTDAQVLGGPSAWRASSPPSPGSTWPCATARGLSTPSGGPPPGPPPRS